MATVLYCMAAALGAVSLIAWARVGPGALAGALFGVLGVMGLAVHAGRTARLDNAVDAVLAEHRTPVGQFATAQLHHYIGQPVHFATVVVFFGILLSLHARSVLRGPLVVGAVGIGVVIEESLKAVLAPHGFPSGHVTVTAAFLGTVAVCLGRKRGWAARAMLTVVAAAGVVSVAVIAIYSGAHTVSEAIGGMVLGAALASLAAAALRAVPARRRSAMPVGCDAPTVAIRRRARAV